jgi:hypothetical protein
VSDLRWGQMETKAFGGARDARPVFQNERKKEKKKGRQLS